MARSPSRRTEPAQDAVAVTPHDSNPLANQEGVRGIYVGTTGNLSVIFKDSDVVTFVGVQAGSLLPISPRIVRSTLTTASDIVALY